MQDSHKICILRGREGGGGQSSIILSGRQIWMDNLMVGETLDFVYKIRREKRKIFSYFFNSTKLGLIYSFHLY